MLLFGMKLGNDIINASFPHLYIRQFHINLRHYFLMMSNARIYLSLQVTVCICVIMFIFQPLKRRDMLLSDIQYGHFYLFELTTGDRDQCGNQGRDTADYTRC